MNFLSSLSNFRASLQFKLFLNFSLLTFLIACLLSTLYITSEIREANKYAGAILQLRAGQLADAVRLTLYAENRDMLRLAAEQTALLTPETRSVMISTRDGRVLVNIRPPVPPSTPAVFIRRTAEVRSSTLVDSIDSTITGSQEASPLVIGTVSIEQGTSALSRSINQMIMFSIGMAIAFWLMLALLSYLVFKKVTRTFSTLVQGINVLQNGDFSSRIEISSDDEAGRTARAVNELANSMQQRSEENRQLQEERLNLERQMLHSNKLESLGVMAGGIAHDFNNLLQTIIGNAELALMELPTASAAHKHIVNVMDSAGSAAHLTGLMLAYAGKGVFDKKILDLNKLISKNVELFRLATPGSVSFELQLPAVLPAIMADESQLQQVVMNLITNAAESIDKQSGLVRLSTGTLNCDREFLTASLLEVKPEPGEYLFLEVSDNGCGMDEDTVKRLFEPFFTTKFTGRGLGMSAVMGIMKSHHGALFVKSEPGRGSTFTIFFPVSQAALPAEVSDPEAAPPKRGALHEKGSSRLALVVDDEKAVLRVCSKMVSLCGFTVITACDGIDAVAKFREHAAEITVVVMDLTMPKMDGIAAMGEIYRIRPDARVILSSGFNEEELCERVTDQAPSGFIRKPYSMRVLEAELQMVVPLN